MPTPAVPPTWGSPPRPPRGTAPGAPPATPAERAVVLAALALGAAAAVLLPGGPPGAGAVVLAALAVVVVLALRRTRPTAWQVVHAALAAALVVPAVVLDAPWVVRLDLLTALVLTAVALAPHRTGASVLAALPRLLGHLPRAGAQLVRGVTGRSGVGRGLGPLARGALIAAVLLAVFVPLLVAADPRFAEVLRGLADLGDAHPLAGVVAFVVTAVTATAVLQLLRRPRPDVHLPAPVAVLRRTAEWLLPLGALDVLLAGFVAVRTRELSGRTGAPAQLVHEGFFQLVAVTGLVLLVVVAALRWTPAGSSGTGVRATLGVRAALGVLCALTLLVDAAALQQLFVYTTAMGWTRLRAGVAVICLGLAAVLVVLLVAGAIGLRRPRGSGSGTAGGAGWVPHAVVLVAGLSVLGLTAADPDARIAASQVARGDEVDLVHLGLLSADAVPAITALPADERGCVLARMDPTGTRWADARWTSANASRARAREVLDELGPATCRWPAAAAFTAEPGRRG